ncbi:hypothetical protein [Vibrio metschnikovii]
MNDKQETTTVCGLSETPDVGVVFTYNPDLEKSELPIGKFKICQLKMCAAIAAALSRQCPGITAEQSQMGTIIKAADLVCNAVNNQVQTEQGNSKDNSAIKAEAVMNFANTLIAAFEAGFIDEHKSDLADLYSAARVHVKINYQYEAKSLVEEWGENLAEICKNGDLNIDL